MTLDYIEASDDYPYTIAEICFDDEEEKLYLEVEKILISKGWEMNYSVENWVYVEVANFEEYKKFSRAYKAALKKVNQKPTNAK